MGGFIGKSEENSARAPRKRSTRAPTKRGPLGASHVHAETQATQATRTEREGEICALPRSASLARHLAIPQQEVCGPIRQDTRARGEAERVVLVRAQPSTRLVQLVSRCSPPLRHALAPCATLGALQRGGPPRFPPSGAARCLCAQAAGATSAGRRRWCSGCDHSPNAQGPGDGGSESRRCTTLEELDLEPER